MVRGAGPCDGPLLRKKSPHISQMQLLLNSNAKWAAGREREMTRPIRSAGEVC